MPQGMAFLRLCEMSVELCPGGCGTAIPVRVLRFASDGAQREKKQQSALQS
jgi:hypothetical protein